MTLGLEARKLPLAEVRTAGANPCLGCGASDANRGLFSFALMSPDRPPKRPKGPHDKHVFTGVARETCQAPVSLVVGNSAGPPSAPGSHSSFGTEAPETDPWSPGGDGGARPPGCPVPLLHVTVKGFSSTVRASAAPSVSTDQEHLVWKSSFKRTRASSGLCAASSAKFSGRDSIPNCGSAASTRSRVRSASGRERLRSVESAGGSAGHGGRPFQAAIRPAGPTADPPHRDAPLAVPHPSVRPYTAPPTRTGRTSGR